MANPYDQYLSTHFGALHDPSDRAFSKRYFDANVVFFMPEDTQDRILDIGCGTGDFLRYVIDKGYKNYIGVDISSEQVRFCKKYVTNNVLLIRNLETYLKKHRNEFDFILMNDVIEHIPKDEIIDTMSSLHNSLKRGGKVLIKTANLKHRWGMAVRYMDFTHTVGFAEESMRQVMKLSGFKTIELRSEIHPIHDLRSLCRILLKKTFEYIYRLEYLASFGSYNPILTNMFIAVGIREK